MSTSSGRTCPGCAPSRMMSVNQAPQHPLCRVGVLELRAVVAIAVFPKVSLQEVLWYLVHNPRTVPLPLSLVLRGHMLPVSLLCQRLNLALLCLHEEFVEKTLWGKRSRDFKFFCTKIKVYFDFFFFYQLGFSPCVYLVNVAVSVCREPGHVFNPVVLMNSPTVFICSFYCLLVCRIK